MSSQIVFPWKQRKLHHNEKPILHKNGRDFQLISVERRLIYCIYKRFTYRSLLFLPTLTVWK